MKCHDWQFSIRAHDFKDHITSSNFQVDTLLPRLSTLVVSITVPEDLRYLFFLCIDSDVSTVAFIYNFTSSSSGERTLADPLPLSPVQAFGSEFKTNQSDLKTSNLFLNFPVRKWPSVTFFLFLYQSHLSLSGRVLEFKSPRVNLGGFSSIATFAPPLRIRSFKYRDISSATWRVRLLSIATFALPPGERIQRTSASCLSGSISRVTDRRRRTPGRTKDWQTKSAMETISGVRYERSFSTTGQINAWAGWIGQDAPGTTSDRSWALSPKGGEIIRIVATKNEIWLEKNTQDDLKKTQLKEETAQQSGRVDERTHCNLCTGFKCFPSGRRWWWGVTLNKTVCSLVYYLFRVCRILFTQVAKSCFFLLLFKKATLYIWVWASKIFKVRRAVPPPPRVFVRMCVGTARAKTRAGFANSDFLK